jgi:hypothetical protein
MNSFVASFPPASVTAVRAAFISNGTVLNLLSGKKPACGGRACTASGASSFRGFSRSAGVSPVVDCKPSSSTGSAPRAAPSPHYADFVAHYHGERNHQGISNELIQPLGRTGGRGPVRCRPRTGGLLNYYYRVA